jgi:hypothetical protein
MKAVRRVPAATCGGAVVGLVLMGAGTVLAQSQGGDFEVPRAVIAGGTGVAQGGVFRSSATTGQHDAGTSSGGEFRVSGGFWPVAEPRIFRDGFESG